MRRWWWSLNPLGVGIGAVLLLLSLTPSLLPRPATLQGLASGLVFGVGYAFGVACWAVWSRLTGWRPSPRTRRWANLVGWPLFAVALASSVIGGIAAQNGVRRAVELPPLDGVNTTGFILVLTMTTLACLGAGRLVRTTWNRMLDRRVSRGASRRQASRSATVRTLIASVLVLALLGTTVYVALDRIYYGLNAKPSGDAVEPDSQYRSAGAGSEVRFTELGRHGADFVSGGPTAEQITTLTGKPAMTPVRVYVGLAAGGTLADRAQIAVRELERTGGFDRAVLVIAATTGSGWLEPQAVDAVEYLHSGDTAIVSLQYAHTPSFVSALTAPHLTVDASTALFSAVRQRWLQLPEQHRPKLVVYGLSLGSQGLMNHFGTLEQLRQQTDGSLFVGPTNSTPMWRELQQTRDAGSPPWQPIRDAGSEVRWASQEGDFGRLSGPWHQPRVAILQHATDPITWLGPELLWQRPEWLTEGNRAPDVSPQMHWLPVVTAVQLGMDVLVATDVPARHGHAFGDVMVEGWVNATGDGGLDQASLTAIQQVIESYWVIRPAIV